MEASKSANALCRRLKILLGKFLETNKYDLNEIGKFLLPMDIFRTKSFSNDNFASKMYFFTILLGRLCRQDQFYFNLL